MRWRHDTNDNNSDNNDINGNLNACSTGKMLYAVRNTRNIGKKDMILNNLTPVITVDPESYRVEADGVHLTCKPSSSLPLAQRYYLF